MTEREFSKKLAELKARLANAEETQREAIKAEMAELRESFEDETRLMQRSSVKTPQKGIVQQLREAMEANQRSITVQGYTPSGGTAVAGVHDDVIETEVQGILDPLYANSILGQLGVRFYSGLPQGDIQIPKMTKGSVGWAGEISSASESGETFSHVTLKPKRLTAYCDISKQLIVQDTIGAEQAIRRDLVKAIGDKLEATIFGAANGDATKPTGMFYNKTLGDATTFAKICGIEAGVENNNVFGEMKYVMNPGAKADLRAMAKSSKNTQLVFEGGSVDGVPAYTSSNVDPTVQGAYIYGNFNYLAVGAWGGVEIILDPYTKAADGCVRLVVNAFFDAQVLESNAFAFGNTRYTAPSAV